MQTCEEGGGRGMIVATINDEKYGIYNVIVL
jgi:hypothetical protein